MQKPLSLPSPSLSLGEFILSHTLLSLYLGGCQWPTIVGLIPTQPVYIYNLTLYHLFLYLPPLPFTVSPIQWTASRATQETS